MHYRKLASKIFTNGYEPFPLKVKSKVPALVNPSWSNADITSEQVDLWAANGLGSGGIGVRCCSVIDVDVKDVDAAKSMAKEIADILSGNGVILKRFGQIPKFMVPLQGSWGAKSVNKWFDKDGNKQEIEYLNAGDQYWVSHGIHPDTNAEYRWTGDLDITTVSKNLLPIIDSFLMSQVDDAFNEIAESLGWTRDTKKNKQLHLPTPHGEDDAFATLKVPSGNVEELKKIIARLPPNMAEERDEWIKVCAAIHFETSGSDEGFELFHGWSKGAASYKDEKDCRGRWDSFKDQAGKSLITIGSLIHHAQEDSSVQDDAALELSEMISSATEVTDIEKIFKTIRGDKAISILRRKELAVLLLPKVNEIVGKGAYNLTEVKKAIACKADGGELVSEKEVPAWAEKWVFVAHQNAFCKIGKPGYIMRSGFNGVYNRKLRTIGEDTVQADTFVLDNDLVPAVYEAIYLPGAGEFFQYDCHSCVNLYNPDSEREAIPRNCWSDRGLWLVNRMKAHIGAMFDPSDATTLLDFMSFVVMYPEKRVLWVPILHGCEGDGKTVICSLLAAMVGSVNSTIVNASEIVDSAFNDWAAGGRVKVIEELKISGKNRHVAVNKIKPLITNPVISIHPKGMKAFCSPNTASYMATTNFLDAVPIDDRSRRFALLISRYRSMDDVVTKFGTGAFEELWCVVREAAGEFKGYLIERGISDSFNPFKAPNTMGNTLMIEAETPEYKIRALSVITDGKVSGVNADCICVSKLNLAIEMEGEKLYPKQIAAMLTEFGFRRYGRIKIDGIVETFWTKLDYTFSAENNQGIRNLAFEPEKDLF